MSCDGWKERLIDKLYGELASDEESKLSAHLLACEPCRRELFDLTATHEVLSDAAPAVPVAPRVVILSRPARRVPVWAVAAGLSGLGLLAGLALSWAWQARTAASQLARDLAVAREETAAVRSASLPAQGEIDRRVRDGIEQYMSARNATGSGAVSPKGTPDRLTRDEVNALLARFDREVDRERASDLRYVLDEMAGMEARTSLRLGETQQAIRYVALANDPRLSEQ